MATKLSSKHKDALEAYSKGLEYLSGCPDCDWDIKKARKCFGLAIKKDPNFVEAYEKLADIALQSKSGQKDAEPDLAIKLLNKSIEINPHRANAYFTLSDLYWSELSRSDLAIKNLDSVLRIDSNHPKALRLRGFVKYSIQDFEGAKKDIDKAAKLKPKDMTFLPYEKMKKYLEKRFGFVD